MQIISDGWYTAYNLKKGLWGIDDFGHDTFYAVIGEKRALMIDNGYGAGRLDEFMARLTDLPWITAATHGHIDHCNGNDFFDEAYLAEEDFELLDDEEKDIKRELLLRDPRILIGHESGFRTIGGCHARKATHIIEDGQVFDLGGRTVTAWKVPGHTNGSVCFIDDWTRSLFIGDMYVPLQEWNEMWFHVPNCAPLSVAAKSVRRAWDMHSQYNTVLSGHGTNFTLLPRRLKELADALDGLVGGSIQGSVFPNQFGDSETRVYRQDHFGIVYDTEKIY